MSKDIQLKEALQRSLCPPILSFSKNLIVNRCPRSRRIGKKTRNAILVSNRSGNRVELGLQIPSTIDRNQPDTHKENGQYRTIWRYQTLLGATANIRRKPPRERKEKKQPKSQGIILTGAISPRGELSRQHQPAQCGTQHPSN